MVTDHSTKPTRSSLLACQHILILGFNEKEFGMFKKWHEDVLKKHDLWDKEEADLDSL